MRAERRFERGQVGVDVGDDGDGVPSGEPNAGCIDGSLMDRDQPHVALSASQASSRRHSRAWRGGEDRACRSGRARRRSDRGSRRCRPGSPRSRAGPRTPRSAAGGASRGAADGPCGRSGWRRAWSSTSVAHLLRRCRRGSRAPRRAAAPAGSGMSQSSTVVGTYGQASPQPIVITAQSACSCISRSSAWGSVRRCRCRPRASPPPPSARSASAGSLPADSARTSAGAWRSKNAWAIWERPALWLQTNSTYLMAAPPAAPAPTGSRSCDGCGCTSTLAPRPPA